MFFELLSSGIFNQYSKTIQCVAEKCLHQKRISLEEVQELLKLELGHLGMLAASVCKQRHENTVYYIRNAHIEPSNICRFHCRFCAYRRDERNGYVLSPEEIAEKTSLLPADIRELHIVGSVHPNKQLDYYLDILRLVRQKRPDVFVKAYSAVEIHAMAEGANLSLTEILKMLRQAGLDGIPGGGAEILDDDIRAKICPDKVNSKGWLDVHRNAHKLGIPTNATMLYGHIESWEHRIAHMEKIRQLQDETNGFQAFIPLKFRRQNNELSSVPETSFPEDLRIFAISRIFLDNIPHIKAYWPMFGFENALLALDFGANDMDGTIHNTTRIFSDAGSEEQYPVMQPEMLADRLAAMGKMAVERDGLYHKISN